MRRENRRTVSEEVTNPAEVYYSPNLLEDNEVGSARNAGLSGHVFNLRKKNKGFSRWIALAVLVGGVVALAIVQFAMH
jgi:hypothetical protein